MMQEPAKHFQVAELQNVLRAHLTTGLVQAVPLHSLDVLEGQQCAVQAVPLHSLDVLEGQQCVHKMMLMAPHMFCSGITYF